MSDDNKLSDKQLRLQLLQESKAKLDASMVVARKNKVSAEISIMDFNTLLAGTHDEIRILQAEGIRLPDESAPEKTLVPDTIKVPEDH